MNFNDFAYGVVTSLVATALWQVATKKLNSPFFFPYPDIRKTTWIGNYELDGHEIQEEINIDQQFWKWCSGTFTWSNPEDLNERIKYNFKGKFVMHHLLAGTFRPKERRYMDFGTFLFAFQHDTKTAEGGSVSINFKTNRPMSIEYSMTRCTS
jgi:hypothetical protein